MRASHLSAVLCLFLAATFAAAQTHQWPQWQGPDRDSLTDETGLLQSWPEGGPRRAWLFEKCGTGYAGPAVVDGRLYIMGAREGTAMLLALDANTGDEIWATPISPEFENDWGNGPRSTPTVENGLVHTLSANGTLVCLRTSDGSEVWRVTMQDLGGSIPQWGYSESVLIDGDLILCTPGGANGAIAALDKTTGELRWQSHELDDGAHYSSIMPAVFHGQRQYVQLLEHRLVGVAADDGRLLWEVPWPGRVAVIPTPLVHGNQVFATSGYGSGCVLVEIGPDNEAVEVYRHERMKNHHGGVIRLGEHIFGHSDNVGWLSMDWQSGEQNWRERSALGKGAIGYADSRFYCVSEDDGEVVLIDATPDGWQEHGRFTLSPQSTIRKDRGKIWVHPVIVDGKLYLRDQDLLYCYDVRAE